MGITGVVNMMEEFYNNDNDNVSNYIIVYLLNVH